MPAAAGAPREGELRGGVLALAPRAHAHAEALVEAVPLVDVHLPRLGLGGKARRGQGECTDFQWCRPSKVVVTAWRLHLTK